MADKWWDISDDDLDELFREASDKVETPFDPSALAMLKSKMSGASAVPQKSTWKRWAWIPLLLLLLFSSGVIYKYYSSDNQSITTKNPKQQPLFTSQEVSTNKSEKNLSTNQQTLKIGETTTNSGEGEGSLVGESSPNSVSERKSTKIAADKLIESSAKIQLDNNNSSTDILKEKQTIPSSEKKNLGYVKKKSFTAIRQNYVSGTNSKVATIFSEENVVESKTKSATNSGIKLENGVSFNPNNSSEIVTEYNSTNAISSEKTIEEVVQKTDFYGINYLKNKDLSLFKNSFQPVTIAIPQDNLDEVKPVVLAKPIKSSRFGIRLAISPEINSVENIGPFAVGSSMGFMIEYRLSKRLILQTGITNSKKKYESDINAYHAWRDAWKVRPVQPTSVGGSCNVLDVPINLRYNLGGKRNNNWFVNGGISSYLLINENYSWYFATQPTTERQWTDNAKYYWSTLNLSFGLEKSLTRHISLQAEPYMKVPLGLVGRGKVNIFSSGILFSAKYGF
jgi:Outer membrane protein beta-barrel domain